VHDLNFTSPAAFAGEVFLVYFAGEFSFAAFAGGYSPAVYAGENWEFFGLNSIRR
jgi:hypothetical protein